MTKPVLDEVRVRQHVSYSVTSYISPQTVLYKDDDDIQRALTSQGASVEVAKGLTLSRANRIAERYGSIPEQGSLAPGVKVVMMAEETKLFDTFVLDRQMDGEPEPALFERLMGMPPGTTITFELKDLGAIPGLRLSHAYALSRTVRSPQDPDAEPPKAVKEREQAQFATATKRIDSPAG